MVYVMVYDLLVKCFKWSAFLMPLSRFIVGCLSLVSTYVVCERLSVMHEPAGVVEILVQILQNTPFWNTVSEYPLPPENENCQRSWHFDFSVSEYPPLENENCQRSWHFDFSVSEYPPPPKMKIVRDLGTLTFQFQNTPDPKKWKLSEILALWLFSFRIPPHPPSPKMKIVRDLGTLTFQFQNTPLPQNWNLGRSWQFKTFHFQNTPPRKLKLRQILTL